MKNKRLVLVFSVLLIASLACSLLDGGNKLGLALMTHTHLKDLIIYFKKKSGGLLREARRRASKSMDVGGGLKKRLRETPGS